MLSFIPKTTRSRSRINYFHLFDRRFDRRLKCLRASQLSSHLRRSFFLPHQQMLNALTVITAPVSSATWTATHTFAAITRNVTAKRLSVASSAPAHARALKTAPFPFHAAPPKALNALESAASTAMPIHSAHLPVTYAATMPR